MAFAIEQAKELYLLDTKLENIFINEFMTTAPGDHVKVYLLSLMYANAEIEADNSLIAKQLSIEEEDVLKAWNYWEGEGVIRKKHKNTKDKFNYDVEFLSFKERLYGSKTVEKDNPDKKFPSLLNDSELQNLYQAVQRITGRILVGTEST